MTFKTYPLRFRLFHSNIKQGNLTAFILSSIRHKTKKYANDACSCNNFQPLALLSELHVQFAIERGHRRVISKINGN